MQMNVLSTMGVNKRSICTKSLVLLNKLMRELFPISGDPTTLNAPDVFIVWLEKHFFLKIQQSDSAAAFEDADTERCVCAHFRH